MSKGFEILLQQRFDDGEVDVRAVASSRDESRDAALQQPWEAEKARLGDVLFDGPMARLESHQLADRRLILRVSRTSYRAFVCTNLHGPRDLPRACCANPIGVSTLLESADGHYLFGRRSGRVAYYPHRLHPFAGSLEWPAGDEPIDVFTECRRELEEELQLGDPAIESIHLIGIVEDRDIRHPELVLHTTTSSTVEDLKSGLDRFEHDEIVAIPVATAQSALADERFTPVAKAALTLTTRRAGV